jgi:hypothetical protein
MMHHEVLLQQTRGIQRRLAPLVELSSVGLDTNDCEEREGKSVFKFKHLDD